MVYLYTVKFVDSSGRQHKKKYKHKLNQNNVRWIMSALVNESDAKYKSHTIIKQIYCEETGCSNLCKYTREAYPICSCCIRAMKLKRSERCFQCGSPYLNCRECCKNADRCVNCFPGEFESVYCGFCI